MDFSLAPLTFKLVLTDFSHAGKDSDGHVIRYRLIENDEEFMKNKRGVYVVTHNEKAVYFGKYSRTFARRWLYSTHIFHFLRNRIGPDLQKYPGVSQSYAVYAQTETELRRQLGDPKNDWIDVHSIEAKLIRVTPDIWNKQGRI